MAALADLARENVNGLSEAAAGWTGASLPNMFPCCCEPVSTHVPGHTPTNAHLAGVPFPRPPDRRSWMEAIQEAEFRYRAALEEDLVIQAVRGSGASDPDSEDDHLETIEKDSLSWRTRQKYKVRLLREAKAKLLVQVRESREREEEFKADMENFIKQELPRTHEKRRDKHLEAAHAETEQTVLKLLREQQEQDQEQLQAGYDEMCAYHQQLETRIETLMDLLVQLLSNHDGNPDLILQRVQSDEQERVRMAQQRLDFFSCQTEEVRKRNRSIALELEKQMVSTNSLHERMCITQKEELRGRYSAANKLHIIKSDCRAALNPVRGDFLCPQVAHDDLPVITSVAEPDASAGPLYWSSRLVSSKVHPIVARDCDLECKDDAPTCGIGIVRKLEEDFHSSGIEDDLSGQESTLQLPLLGAPAATTSATSVQFSCTDNDTPSSTTDPPPSDHDGHTHHVWVDAPDRNVKLDVKLNEALRSAAYGDKVVRVMGNPDCYRFGPRQVLAQLQVSKDGELVASRDSKLWEPIGVLLNEISSESTLETSASASSPPAGGLSSSGASMTATVPVSMESLCKAAGGTTGSRVSEGRWAVGPNQGVGITSPRTRNARLHGSGRAGTNGQVSPPAANLPSPSRWVRRRRPSPPSRQGSPCPPCSGFLGQSRSSPMVAVARGEPTKTRVRRATGPQELLSVPKPSPQASTSTAPQTPSAPVPVWRPSQCAMTSSRRASNSVQVSQASNSVDRSISPTRLQATLAPATASANNSMLVQSYGKDAESTSSRACSAPPAGDPESRAGSMDLTPGVTVAPTTSARGRREAIQVQTAVHSHVQVAAASCSSSQVVPSVAPRTSSRPCSPPPLRTTLRAVSAPIARVQTVPGNAGGTIHSNAPPLTGSWSWRATPGSVSPPDHRPWGFAAANRTISPPQTALTPRQLMDGSRRSTSAKGSHSAVTSPVRGAITPATVAMASVASGSPPGPCWTRPCR